MSLELVVLLVILALVAYLVVRFHVTLAKFVPGKAGDFLDDFKLNNSNLTGDHVVQAVQAVGSAVAQSVQAVSSAPAAPAPIDWSQYATVQDAILRLQGKGLGVDQIIAQWTSAHPGSDPTHVDTPSGTRDTSPLWTAFDGHACRVTSQPGVPMTFSVNVGKPFTLSVSEAGSNTAPGGSMTLTAVREGTQVATITKPFAQAVDLPVPVGDAVVTAVYDKVSTFDVTVRQG